MSEEFTFGGEVVWRPTADYIDQSHLTQFIREHKLSDFDNLMNRSTEDVAWFTEAVLNYLDIQFYEPYSQVLDISQGIAKPRWVVGGKMNIVHNLLDKYIGSEVENQVALITEDETGEVNAYTYGELWRKVNQAANALRSLGLGAGDPIPADAAERLGHVLRAAQHGRAAAWFGEGAHRGVRKRHRARVAESRRSAGVRGFESARGRGRWHVRESKQRRRPRRRWRTS